MTRLAFLLVAAVASLAMVNSAHAVKLAEAPKKQTFSNGKGSNGPTGFSNGKGSNAPGYAVGQPNLKPPSGEPKGYSTGQPKGYSTGSPSNMQADKMPSQGLNIGGEKAKLEPGALPNIEQKGQQPAGSQGGLKVDPSQLTR